MTPSDKAVAQDLECYPVHMAVQFRLALFVDYDPAVIAHQVIPEALRLFAGTGHSVEGVWVHT
jgi:hypothetical protein